MTTPYWLLQGNAGTDPSADFVGTTDDQPLVIKTNGQQSIYVDTNQNVGLAMSLEVQGFASADAVGIGTGGEVPAAALQIVSGNAGPPAAQQAMGGLMLSAIPNWIQGYADGTLGNPAATAPLALNPAGSKVGIGTMAPDQVLSVSGADSTPNGFGASIGISNTAPGGANWYFRTGATGTATPPGGFSIANDAAYLLTIDDSGNVRIGALQVNENVTVNGNVYVAQDVILTGADCAEHFDATGLRPPEPGAVVVIDDDGALIESREEYDTKVAGVVSGAGEFRHGLVLDGRPSEKDRIPVAMVGKVYCKVDAQYSPVRVGDLLTTSQTPGHAMKATDARRAFGAVIGKALRPLKGGQGLIPILACLQ